MSQELQGDNNLPSDSDHRMERIWSDFESVETYLDQDANGGPSTEGKVESPVTAASTSTLLRVGFPHTSSLLVSDAIHRMYSR